MQTRNIYKTPKIVIDSTRYWKTWLYGFCIVVGLFGVKFVSRLADTRSGGGY
ncbi:MAG: hypothetical protein LBL39_00750 [Planctomycetaceae bacterium]|nr:hypothetical protein [Planctomycetaceae bacterium]